MAQLQMYFDAGNREALKIVIASESVGCTLTLKKVDPGVKLVDFLASDCLPVLILASGEKIFSSNSACRYVWNVGKKCTEDDGKDDVWLEWEATQLKPAVDAVLTPGARTGTTTINSILRQLEAHLSDVEANGNGLQIAVRYVAIWCTLYRLFTSDSLGTELRSLFPVTALWFTRLGNHKAFRVGLQKIGLPELAPIESVDVPKISDADLSELEQVFVECKWRTRKQRSTPLLPEEGERNMLITSALPYVNNVPHLGNIIGCVLSADVYTRFCRLRDYNVLYVCGTDEYGTATETKAIEEGLTPQEICDKYHKLHSGIYQWFDIAFDFFGRTTTHQQTEIAQEIFWDLHKNNFIIQDSIEQLLCEQCNRYLADRFVEGICPFCSADDARGDQCDRCGKLINAIELKQPKCKLCRHTPVVRSSKHLFLDLPQLVDRLTSHLDKAYQDGLWTSNAKMITESWLKSGLKPRCISRDLKWGTPVPLEGFTDKVFYVWFDAPIGYISITANYTDQWERWWKNPSQVQLYNFMAKDNVPFHSVIFPCSLLGTGQPWTVVTNMSATEYLNYEDGKFSKSRGLGVFGDSAMDAGIDADIFRFYLLYVRPETQDTAFSWDDLMLKNNSELLSNLGNFINRGLMFVANKFDGKLPRIEFTQQERELVAAVTNELKEYIDSLERIRLRDGIRHILNISARGNGYIQATKPWDLLKGTEQDRARAGTVASLSCNLSYLLAVLLSPYMPTVAETILSQLNMNNAQQLNNKRFEHVLEAKFVQFLPEGHQIGKPEPLFKKIEPSQIQQLKEKFGDRQNVAVNESAKPVDKEHLKKLIDEQGDIVRQLKAAKADKPKVDAEVALLLTLKRQLSVAEGTTGLDKQTTNKSKKKT